jgi:hypothetical protein
MQELQLFRGQKRMRIKGLLKWAAVCAAVAIPAAPTPSTAQSTAVRHPPRTAILQPRVRPDTVATRRLTEPAAMLNDSSPSRTVLGQSAARARASVAAPTIIDRTRLEQVLGGSAASLRVVRAAGVADVPRTTDVVRIMPGEFVFRKVSDTARRDEPGGVSPSIHSLPGGVAAYTVPYRWLTVDSAGVERLLVPFFILAQGRLSYDVRSRMYQGMALVGVEDTLHPTEGPVSLPRPLLLQITTTNGGSVSPLTLKIVHTGLEYDSIRIESPGRDSDSPRLTYHLACPAR